jgi:hypothetical protein
MTRNGMESEGMEWYGKARYVMEWEGMERKGKERHGMERQGKERYGMAWVYFKVGYNMAR